MQLLGRRNQQSLQSSEVRTVKGGRKTGALQFASYTRVDKRWRAKNLNQLPQPLFRLGFPGSLWSAALVCVCTHVHAHTYPQTLCSCEPRWLPAGMGVPRSHVMSVAPTQEGLLRPTWRSTRGLKPVCFWHGSLCSCGQKPPRPKPQSRLLFSKTAIIHPLKDQRLRKCARPHLEKSWQDSMPQLDGSIMEETLNHAC